jgi:hypothetical protein
MNRKLISFLVALAAVVAALGASALAADAQGGPGPNYCDPLGGCPFLKVSPSTVKAGRATTVSGSTGNGCHTPGQVTIISHAFRGATRRQFAGVPAIFTTANGSGKFSRRVTIAKAMKPGAYHVGARCGGGSFGSATLRVH